MNSLDSFLCAAIAEKPSLDRFIDLRYSTLARQFPHDTFSVAQATPDFFEVALKHLRGGSFAGDDKDQSVYEMNYRRWIRKHRINS